MQVRNAILAVVPALVVVLTPAAAGTAARANADVAAGIPPGSGTPVPAAIHVHSTFSNGEHDILDLARMAAQEGVQVLVLTDSFLTTVNYGVPPLDRLGIPGLNRIVRPGVLDHGVDRYLAAVRKASETYPNLMILPGAEVAPYYRWSGRPWGRLELRDFDQHLFVVGLAEDALRNLPVIGNETWSNTRFRFSRALLPLVLLSAGAVLLRTLRNRSRQTWPAWLLLAAGMILAWNHWPYGTLGDPHSTDPGERRTADQRLIDYVQDHGGLVFWCYPEARYKEVKTGRAVMISRPHPEDLIATRNYQGFEGLYGDEITATLPGREWDQALQEVLAGERELPPSVVTGIDYHGKKAKKDGGDRWDSLTGGRTVLYLKTRDAAGVLHALRTGAGYATFQGEEETFLLDRFQAEADSGGRIQVDLAMSWENEAPASPRPFQVELILDGAVVFSGELELPFRRRFHLDAQAGPHYVRMQASAGRLNRLLSNPIFLEVDGGERRLSSGVE